MKKVGIFLILLLVASGAKAQSQSQSQSNSTSQTTQTINTQNQKPGQSSGELDKIKNEIKRQQLPKIKAPNAHTGVRG